MKKILYYCRQDTKTSSGVGKKVFAQIRMLASDFDVSLMELTDENEILRTSANSAIIMQQHQKGMRTRFLAQKLVRANATRRFHQAVTRIVREEGIDLLFVRLNRLDLSLLRVLQCAFRAGCKIVMEIPTYPYLPEIRKMRFPVNVYWEVMDWLCRPHLKKYVSAIVTCAPEKRIFGIHSIQIPNGYDFSRQKLRQMRKPNKRVHLFVMAIFHDWHGYDRLLTGLAAYRKQEEAEEVLLHFVGNGPMLESYQKYASEHGLLACCIFHDRQNDDGIYRIASECDIAIDSLGCHRKSISLSSSLKSREYAALGFPIVTSTAIDIFEPDDPNVLYVPDDDTPIDINEIIRFYHRFYDKAPEEIRRQSENIRQRAMERSDISVTYAMLRNAIRSALDDTVPLC